MGLFSSSKRSSSTVVNNNTAIDNRAATHSGLAASSGGRVIINNANAEPLFDATTNLFDTTTNIFTKFIDTIGDTASSSSNATEAVISALTQVKESEGKTLINNIPLILFGGAAIFYIIKKV